MRSPVVARQVPRPMRLFRAGRPVSDRGRRERTREYGSGVRIIRSIGPTRRHGPISPGHPFRAQRVPSSIAIGASDSAIQTYAFLLRWLRLALEESAKMSVRLPWGTHRTASFVVVSSAANVCRSEQSDCQPVSARDDEDRAQLRRCKVLGRQELAAHVVSARRHERPPYLRVLTGSVLGCYSIHRPWWFSQGSRSNSNPSADSLRRVHSKPSRRVCFLCQTTFACCTDAWYEVTWHLRFRFRSIGRNSSAHDVSVPRLAALFTTDVFHA